jgi:D-alanyl-D-alanine carboxypeptidase/D-alanyl-D-alanine-endopeptidase (penicillin-binding protein 4)
MRKCLLLLAFLVLAMPAQAQQQAVETTLETAPKGTRFGLLVVDEAGREVVAIAPDQRFIPASNTKLFTTAAAYAVLPGIDRPDEAGGTQVALVPARQITANLLPGVTAKGSVPKGPLDVWLMGRGDARMSSAPDCKVNCLAELADAVAAKTRRVRDVIGDDSFWPDQRWSPGMSWNNIGTDSGTAVSALNLDDNELLVTVKPSAVGQRPVVIAPPYFKLRNEAVTVVSWRTSTLALERPVNGMELTLSGEVPADAKDWRERIGLDDPAHYAAWTFRRMLESRGVKVTGKVRVNHRPVQADDKPHQPGVLGTPIHVGLPALASLTQPSLAEDVVTINKVSQNLHSEALLRRIGDSKGTGSREWGTAALKEILDAARIPRAGYDFSDGSGMSTYNRLSPRATVALLRWVATQPWGKAWYASLPIAGVDGTLKRRFVGTPLAGILAAKTGTLHATSALSGRFRAKSGRMLTFAFFANDVPDGTSATPAMEAVLLLLAESN